MKYLSRYKTETVAACINRERQQEFGYGWFKLPNFYQGAVVYDVVVPYDDQYFHNGIAMDVVIESDSMEEATNIARGAATHIFSLISLCTNTETSRPQERLVLEYDTDIDERSIRQFSPPSEESPTIGTVRELDEQLFYRLYNTIHSEDVSDSYRRKISRCMDRYASALRQNTETDQFVWLFIAFDALEDLFVDHFDISATKEYPCEHCGESNEGPHHNAGKEHFLSESDETSLNYSEIRDIRGQLFHGGPLSGAAEKVEELARVVRLGIAEVIDIPIDECSEMIEQDINGHLREELMIFNGVLTGYQPLELEDFINQPGVDFMRNHVDYAIVGDQIRRQPEDRVSWDFPDQWGIEGFALGYRPIGNVGAPEIGNVDFEMRERD